MSLLSHSLFTIALTGLAFTSAFSAVPQLILPEEPLTHYVDEPVSVQLETDGPVTGYSVKGLPPGLTMSADGLITGRAKKGLPLDSKTGQLKPYRVAITPSNDEGKGATTYLEWLIRPVLTPGYYEGLIHLGSHLVGDEERNTLGSLIKLTATSTGLFSGQILYENKTYRIATTPTFVEHFVHFDLEYTTVRFSLSPGRGQPSINFSLDVGNDRDEFTVTLGEEEEFLAYGYIHRAAFSAKSPAEGYIGSYTWTLPIDGPYLDSPYGAGYATSTISKTGLIRWKGRLGDGSAFTGSSSMLSVKNEDHHVFPLHKVFYKGGGSLHGFITIHPPVAGPNPVRLTAEDLSWEKYPLAETSKERNYKEGIILQNIDFRGASYTPPAKDTFVIDFGATSGNAILSLKGLNIPNEELQQIFTLTDKHRLATPIVVDVDHPLKSLRIDLRQGFFTGTVILTDENWDSPLRPWKRTATFQGVFNQPENVGKGYVLLPDLPDGETTLKNSPIRSTLVEIQLRDR